MVSTEGNRTKEEEEFYGEIIRKKSEETGINILDLLKGEKSNVEESKRSAIDGD